MRPLNIPNKNPYNGEKLVTFHEKKKTNKYKFNIVNLYPQ